MKDFLELFLKSETHALPKKYLTVPKQWIKLQK